MRIGSAHVNNSTHWPNTREKGENAMNPSIWVLIHFFYVLDALQVSDGVSTNLFFNRKSNRAEPNGRTPDNSPFML